MATLSGQVTVTTAGTAVQGPSSPAGRFFAIKAHPDNTDTVWVGNDGEDDVTNSNGFPLDPGEGVVIDLFSIFGTPVDDGVAENLAFVWFDADVNGEKICWIRLG